MSANFDLLNASTGVYGCVRVTSTSPVTPPAGYRFYTLQAVGTANAVFSSITGNITNGNGLTLPIGSTVVGLFTGFTLSSGEVLGYLSPI